jgi:hypothetical protein
MTTINKRLLISESHGDSNRCTPCRGKPDQHAMYSSHATPRTPSVRFLWAAPYVATFHESSTELSRPTALEKKGSRHNPQCATDRSAGPYPTSLLSQPMKQWGQSQASINDQLLGLLGPYHQYAIDMFSTCSRGPTEWSLTDTGRGLQPWRCRLSLYHSPTFPTSCLPIRLVAPPGLHLTKF